MDASANMDMYAEDWAPADSLADDPGGQSLGTMLDALRRKRAALKTELDKGVAPADFAKGQALLESYDAAMTGLEKAWAKRNPHS